jgi:cytochrome c-type biogenesis protein CcmH/NrfG
MKQSSINQLPIWMIVATLIGLVTMIGCTQTQAEDVVTTAYDLRVGGQLDSAQVILTDYMATHDGDANGWFEIARLHTHKGLGNPRSLKPQIDSATTAISKAIELEPKNSVFMFLDGQLNFLTSYMKLSAQPEDPEPIIQEVRDRFEALIEVQPDNAVVLLYLVELYGAMPPETGGSKIKAQEFVELLAPLDIGLAARGEAMLLGEDADLTAFWNEKLAEHPDNALINEAVAKHYLAVGEFDTAWTFVEKAIELDPSRTDLYCDVARSHSYNIMAQRGDKATEVAAATEAFDKYLATNPPASLRAWATSGLAHLARFGGDQASADSLMKEAEKLDKYYSKATAIPGQYLYTEPNVVPQRHSYLFRPM